MTTATPAVLVPGIQIFAEPERLAAAGFLASYTGPTREAYTLDLRQFAAWCHQHRVALFALRRGDIECFARDLEARGRAPSAVSRRLATIAGFCKSPCRTASASIRRRCMSGGRDWTASPALSG